jgi:cytochrome c oxidase cbb3-type subunit 1
MGDYQYDNQTVRAFIISSIFWGVVGILTGVWISILLWKPELNFPPLFTYGRLRPIHINILAFGLVLGALMGIFYYITMRLTKRPLVFPRLARFTVYFFNVGIALGLITLLLGYTKSLNYNEFEWPINVAVVILWVLFAIVILGTIIKRKEEQMYISLWYIIATIVTIAVIYIVNNLSIPVGPFKSYHLFAGVNSANVEWWYGHNAVGSELTMAVLAAFYYFLPKSTGLPIFSHRLSIIAFWSLTFAYLWTGAHHLVYTPIPDWIQTLGIAFTIFLIAPSWGSVINGFYTMREDWSKMRTQYLTKFFILGITFYGLQTVQGPTQGLRVVSQLIHYTDWVVGHVHMGAMGWDALVITGAIYYIIPKMYNTEIYSVKAANTHFWLVLIGQLIYSVTMWIAGIQQGALQKVVSPDGSLRYTMAEIIAKNYPYWKLRTLGGVIFTVGMLFFIYNVFMTIRKGKALAASTA